MESSNLFGGFRALLPYEVELCNALGITDKEYLQFLDLTYKYHKDSRKGYELIPDIRCDPVSAAAWYIGAHWSVKLAVTVAIAAATYLLTPKPKQPKDAPNLQVGGVQGRSRFNPVSGFESVQDLAVLGSFVPLVYAKKGVRVSSQLLWSQIRNTRYGQEINVICLFSHGELGKRPEFKTFAVGETFLDNFPKTKLRLYFSKGGRANSRMQPTTQQLFLNDSNRLGITDFIEGTASNTNTYEHRERKEYDDIDPFMVKVLKDDVNDSDSKFEWRPSFSSVKTPASTAKFGLYAPMPNGSAYKVNWELLLFPKGMDSTVAEDLEVKRQKIVHFYPRYVHLASSSYPEDLVGGVYKEVKSEDDFDLIIEKEENELAWIDEGESINSDRNKRWNKFSPWGSGDAKAVADSTRVETDTNMALGEQYMVGSALATVYQETDGDLWTPHAVNNIFQGKRYKMKVDEPGHMSFPAKDSAFMPYKALIVQKCDIGTFANTKECDETQIGIKSIVWRQISGNLNLNEVPSRERIVAYEKAGGNINVGSINKYVNRLSFFKLQVKILNTDTAWTDVLEDNDTSKVFCVKGSTNQPQYNTINVKHLNSKPLEYRFVPVPGNVVLNLETHRNVYILNYAGELHTHPIDLKDDEGTVVVTVMVYFHAEIAGLPPFGTVDKGNALTNNIEWVRGGLGVGFDVQGNPIGDGSDAVSDIYPKLNPANDTWSSTPFVPTPQRFDPQSLTWWRVYYHGGPWNRGGSNPDANNYTYWGTGPGNVTANWGRAGTATPTERNFKGTPVVGNSYFAPTPQGIALTATELAGGEVRWIYYFGGTLIPVDRSPVIYDRLDSEGALVFDKVHKWTSPIEYFNEDGLATGIFHRFRIARNPAADGGGEDWRFTKIVNGVKTHYFAISVEVQQRKVITPTVTTHDTVSYTAGNNNGSSGSGLIIKRIARAWTDSNGQNRSSATYEIDNPGSGYFTGDTVRLAGSTTNYTDIHTVPFFTLTAGTPTVDSVHPDAYDQQGEGTDFPSHNDYWLNQIDTNPNNAIADYFLYDTESSSHSNGPEHEITYINEIIHEGEKREDATINYEKLAIGGLRIGASSNLNQLASFSCFIEQGIKVQRLIDDLGVNKTINSLTGKSDLFESTDNIVEIVYDLLTNTDYGAGDIAGIKAVNVSDMQESAKYCLENKFRWNGIIDKELNLREFIFENAGYCFLDFCIVGGQFSLRPGLPTNGDGSIRYDVTRDDMDKEVKALFTDGNMKDLQVTFLTPEERRMFKATVIYRQDTKDGFPETKAKTIAYRKSDQTDNDAFLRAAEALPEEVFDMSGWCTDENHAKKFAAFALVTRKDVDHGITFETTPISVLNLRAGDYIRVMTEMTHTSRFKNGSIDNDLNIVSRETISGSQKIYFWEPGENNVVNEDTFVFAGNGKAPSDVLKNTIFTVVDETNEDRLYKIESITHGEEGFIKIAASHVPFDEDGYMSLLRNTNPNDIAVFNTCFPDVNRL